MARTSIRSFLPWLDVVAIAAWGVLLLYYWLSEKLFLLIHPNYIGLTVAAGIFLLFVSGLKGLFLLRSSRSRQPSAPIQHMTLFPPGLGSLLLLTVAIAGLLITPRAFASQTALDRGVTDAITLTRVKPQSFRASTRTEDKTLIDWIRTLQVYPEPDAYTGQKAKVQGFVVYPPNLPEQYLLLTRFVITCCAADAYPVSLPVKLTTGDRKSYSPDGWLEVEGQMLTETLDNKRQLTLQAKSLKSIPEPKNPYNY
ncbi:MAG: TIGR03943 family protein [Candidatus Parcubacteria bacterium]|uniref:TIGR03943 family putative permease subunit n=1 Tax=Phormidesmis priestleyi TaxID=268141 RepID=UPI00083B5302|nr:TIGR03943 family protein [Phormidesmis priestleyi]MBC7823778.1 TIGR03943 family protein [Leptolyngbyaceae cyanobacterium LF-bin-113]